MTPTSLPGLLLGLLVPALRGATFESETPSSASALSIQVRKNLAQSLIATPAHARALLELSAGMLEPLTSVYCVDEGLDTHNAERLANKHALKIIRGPRLPLDREHDEFVARLNETLFRFESLQDLDAVVLRDEAGNPVKMLVTVVGAEEFIDQWRELFGETTELLSRPSLPRDANGRLPRWRTLLQFGYGRNGAHLERSLTWTEVEDPDAEIRRFRTRLPENYAFFEGHYTSYAVLAGAVQLHELALPCIRRVDPDITSLTRLSGLKFMSRIAPGDEVEVTVARGSNGSDLRFEILVGGTLCSAGQLQFDSPSEDLAQ